MWPKWTGIQVFLIKRSKEYTLIVMHRHYCALTLGLFFSLGLWLFDRSDGLQCDRGNNLDWKWSWNEKINKELTFRIQSHLLNQNSSLFLDSFQHHVIEQQIVVLENAELFKTINSFYHKGVTGKERPEFDTIYMILLRSLRKQCRSVRSWNIQMNHDGWDLVQSLMMYMN